MGFNDARLLRGRLGLRTDRPGECLEAVALGFNDARLLRERLSEVRDLLRELRELRNWDPEDFLLSSGLQTPSRSDARNFRRKLPE